MTEDRWDDEKTLYRGEASCAYCFDFQDFPEVTAGETLSSPDVVLSSGPAIVTPSGEIVTTSIFYEYDRNGTVENSVPVGKGVKVFLTPPAVGGAKGECILTCKVNCSGGATRAKRCKIIVK